MAFVCSVHLVRAFFFLHVETVDGATRNLPDASAPNLPSRCVGPDCTDTEVTNNAAAHVGHQRLRKHQKFQTPSRRISGDADGHKKRHPRRTAMSETSTFRARVTESLSPRRLKEEGQCTVLEISKLRFTKGKIDLSGQDDPGFSAVDPFCIFKVGEQQSVKTRTITNNDQPSWGSDLWYLKIVDDSNISLNIECLDDDNGNFGAGGHDIIEKKEFDIDVDTLPLSQKEPFYDGTGKVYIEFDVGCMPVCPSSTTDNEKICRDNRSTDSCKDHHGILKCPLNFPYMCAEKDEHDEHKCRDNPNKCKSLLRNCPQRCGILFLSNYKRIPILPNSNNDVDDVESGSNDKVSEVLVDAGYVLQVFEHIQMEGKDCQLQVGKWELSEPWRKIVSSYKCQKIDASTGLSSEQVEYGDEIVIQNQYGCRQLLRGGVEPELRDSFIDEQVFREKAVVWKLLKTTNQNKNCVLFGDNILIESQHDAKRKLSTNNTDPTLTSLQNGSFTKATKWKVLNTAKQGQGCVLYGDDVVLENRNTEVGGTRMLQRNDGLKLTDDNARIKSLAAVWRFVDASKAMPSCFEPITSTTSTTTTITTSATITSITITTSNATTTTTTTTPTATTTTATNTSTDATTTTTTSTAATPSTTTTGTTATTTALTATTTTTTTTTMITTTAASTTTTMTSVRATTTTKTTSSTTPTRTPTPPTTAATTTMAAAVSATTITTISITTSTTATASTTSMIKETTANTERTFTETDVARSTETATTERTTPSYIATTTAVAATTLLDQTNTVASAKTVVSTTALASARTKEFTDVTLGRDVTPSARFDFEDFQRQESRSEWKPSSGHAAHAIVMDHFHHYEHNNEGFQWPKTTESDEVISPMCLASTIFNLTHYSVEIVFHIQGLTSESSFTLLDMNCQFGISVKGNLSATNRSTLIVTTFDENGTKILQPLSWDWHHVVYNFNKTQSGFEVSVFVDGTPRSARGTRDRLCDKDSAMSSCGSLLGIGPKKSTDADLIVRSFALYNKTLATHEVREVVDSIRWLCPLHMSISVDLEITHDITLDVLNSPTYPFIDRAKRAAAVSFSEVKVEDVKQAVVSRLSEHDSSTSRRRLSSGNLVIDYVIHVTQRARREIEMLTAGIDPAFWKTYKDILNVDAGDSSLGDYTVTRTRLNEPLRFGRRYFAAEDTSTSTTRRAQTTRAPSNDSVNLRDMDFAIAAPDMYLGFIFGIGAGLLAFTVICAFLGYRTKLWRQSDAAHFPTDVMDDLVKSKRAWHRMRSFLYNPFSSDVEDDRAKSDNQPATAHDFDRAFENVEIPAFERQPRVTPLKRSPCEGCYLCELKLAAAPLV